MTDYPIPVVYHPDYQTPKFDAVLLLTEELSGEVLPVPMWAIADVSRGFDGMCELLISCKSTTGGGYEPGWMDVRESYEDVINTYNSLKNKETR